MTMPTPPTDDPRLGMQSYEPIAVAVVSDSTKRESRPKELRSSHQTKVLTTTVPFDMLAGYDPSRKEIRLNNVANPIIICNDRGQASAPENQLIAPVNPRGRIINAGAEDVVIPGQNEIWVACGTYPTLIGFTTVREI